MGSSSLAAETAADAWSPVSLAIELAAVMTGSSSLAAETAADAWSSVSPRRLVLLMAEVSLDGLDASRLVVLVG